MGILSDLFVAEPPDAPSYESLQLSGKLPAGRFERVQFQGLTDLNFSILWAFLESQEWDVKTHVLEEITMGTDVRSRRDRASRHRARSPRPDCRVKHEGAFPLGFSLGTVSNRGVGRSA